jgi:hypothetical protein
MIWDVQSLPGDFTHIAHFACYAYLAHFVRYPRFGRFAGCRPTVCIIGAAADLDSIWEQKNTKPGCPGGLVQGKILENAAESHLPGACLVRRRNIGRTIYLHCSS